MRTARRLGAASTAALLVVLLTGVPARADAWRDRQWYFGPMRLEQAQQLGRGGAGVTVAVIDTGVDTRHRDLRGATVPGWVVTRDEPSDNVDTGPHGTGIATLGIRRPPEPESEAPKVTHEAGHGHGGHH